MGRIHTLAAAMLKVVQVVLFASFANAASPCDSLLTGSRGTTPMNVDILVYENFFVPVCEGYQSALVRHPEVNITITTHNDLVGRDDPFGLPSGAYKLWLYAQMLHYKETDIELMWLDAPWIQSVQDYLEPIPLLPAEKAAFFPKTVHENDAGDLVTIPIKSNYRVNVYNHDLFVKYNVQWPKTWDELEAVCQKVTQGERALGRDFWCLHWDIETHNTNRFASYIAMMASVDGGGDLILPGGIVNVNTPQLRKALVTMKRWINSDVMTPSEASLAAASGPTSFDTQNFLFQQRWIEMLDDYEERQKHATFKMKIGGSLGGEYGVDGAWHLAINKAMRHKDLGVNLVKELIPHLYNVTMNMYFVPAWSGVLDDPVRKAAWCAKVPMYCESYETYTDYHTKLSYRPSKGCGALYNECVQLIAQHLMSGYVHGATDLETAVTDLETGLAKLLGAVNVHEATAASEKAEGSRIALIVVASVSAVLLVLIAVYVRTAMLKLRKVGFKIPVAAMLGFVTAASLVVVTVVVLTQMDASARSISEDLALRLRVASLHSVQSTLHSDDLNNPLLSETQKRRTALSLMMHWVSQLEVEPGSLIFTLTYDQVAAEVQVLMSTDNSVQKEHVFLPVHAPPNGAEVSEVLHAFLQEFGWKLTQGQHFDPKQQHTLSADEEYYVNVKSVDTMPWHIVYIVPVSAVMGEATDSRNAARNYGILASFIAILVVTAFATFITRPLIGVSHHMEMARVMQFDEHYVPGSYLAETRALQEGFRSMAELLVEYKKYLPGALFEEKEQDIVRNSRPPPGITSGTATVVFTDIRSSTSIWEAVPQGMCEALKIHNRIIREAMDEFEGYEVKTIGDAFMVAFATVLDGVNFGLRVHEALRNATWPAELLHFRLCADTGPLWGGLTVRIGVNAGPVTVEKNTLTGRTDYFGHTVNVASRLESTCKPGAVGLRHEVWQEECSGVCSATVGEVHRIELKGVSGKTPVCCVWPASLAGRVTNPLIERRLSGSFRTTASSVVSNTSSKSCMSAKSLPGNVPTSGRLATVGVVQVAVGDEAHASAMRTMSTHLVTLKSCLDRSGGRMVSVMGSFACIAWNLSHAAPAHVENSLRFVQYLHGTSSVRVGGLMTGTVHHGDVSANTLRFVTVLGDAVQKSLMLCIEAKKEGLFFLYEPPVDTVLPQNLERVLTPHRTGVYVVKHKRDKLQWDSVVDN